MTRTLRLARETLVELAPGDLARVAAAAPLPTNPCPLLTHGSPCDTLLCTR